MDKKFKSAWKKKILQWYATNKRDLPWRLKKNQKFYNIWISEVMLQQTQVSVVIPYYKKFIKKWPTLESFFDAKLEEILKIWQGMGYYKRAQNLFKAKELLKKSDKEIEICSSSLKDLPGVGDYISSAISAILNDEACAVIDGNIKRILTRAFNIRSSDKSFNKKIKEISQELTPISDNGNYCQSLMDLANLVCKVRNPKCEICPIFLLCKSKGKIESKKKIIKIKKKISMAFIVISNDKILIDQSEKNLLQNLYCYPLSFFEDINENFVAKNYVNKTANQWMKENNLKVSYEVVGEVVHKFSHFHLKVLIVEIRLDNTIKLRNFIWLKRKELKKKPISKLMFKIKEKVGC